MQVRVNDTAKKTIELYAEEVKALKDIKLSWNDALLLLISSHRPDLIQEAMNQLQADDESEEA